MLNKLKVIIGVTGNARTCGKTTACDYMSDILLKKFDVVSKVLEFGDLIREECSEATGIDIEKFTDDKYKSSLRPLMEWWGSEYRRNELFGGSPTYWTDKMLLTLHHLPQDYELIFINSVSFDREVDFIKDIVSSYPNINYTTIIKIYCKEIDRKPGEERHSSALGINPQLVNHTVYNDKSVDISRFYAQLFPLVERMVTAGCLGVD